jgi:hypothetical protein
LQRPCLKAFRLPFGAPGGGPPCVRHLPFSIAGDWHGFPLRVLAPQRHARCTSKSIGLILRFRSRPTSPHPGRGDGRLGHDGSSDHRHSGRQEGSIAFVIGNSAKHPPRSLCRCAGLAAKAKIVFVAATCAQALKFGYAVFAALCRRFLLLPAHSRGRRTKRLPGRRDLI